jgi:hypothetical protein
MQMDPDELQRRTSLCDRPRSRQELSAIRAEL